MWAPFSARIAQSTAPMLYLPVTNNGATKAMYKHVSDHFRLTCRSTIDKIELCVNTVKWDAYCYKKRILTRGLARGANEQLAFHGTDSAVIDSICMHGFNRSYSTVAVYGHGTYFARHASYSAAPRYAKPNARGQQQMLFCRILAGEPCRGTQGMRQPAAKPSGVLHESMVDSLANPSIYVLSAGSDDCAYPEFRITFH